MLGRFNPSQVQFTQENGYYILQKHKLVSIPHRFNSHRLPRVFYRGERDVSIPHRFNSHFQLKISLLNREFRFNPSQVQFTPLNKASKSLTSTKFQSLTGSIHTLINCYVVLPTPAVSIPHRFNSHFKKLFVALILIFVSIPHRFNSHPAFLSSFTVTRVPFQSLTGSIHTVFKVCIPPCHPGVSIPHRFNSHKSKTFNILLSEMFQSLTGSIHT